MSGEVAGGAGGWASPPPARRRQRAAERGAFPLAGCVLYVPRQLAAAGGDVSTWSTCVARLGGSVTHSAARAASVTHAVLPDEAAPPHAWLPPELLPGSATAHPGLLYVTPAWIADCVAWRERRPEGDYAPHQRFHAAAAASTAAVPAGAEAAGSMVGAAAGAAALLPAEPDAAAAATASAVAEAVAPSHAAAYGGHAAPATPATVGHGGAHVESL